MTAEQNPTDTANEPVDEQDDEFTDTGVLHEQRVQPCVDESCALPHPHPPQRGGDQ